MVGTSLAMAPALLLSGECDIVDLDGPLLLKKDRPKKIGSFREANNRNSVELRYLYGRPYRGPNPLTQELSDTFLSFI